MAGLRLTQAVQDSVESFLVEQGPLLRGEVVGWRLELLSGLGQGILQISDPAAPYLDGLAEEGRAPLGVGEGCRHGGRSALPLHRAAAAG